MSKTAYHISLKGYVGGYDFDRSTDVSKANRRGKATDDRHLVKYYLFTAFQTHFLRKYLLPPQKIS